MRANKKVYMLTKWYRCLLQGIGFNQNVYMLTKSYAC